MRCRQPLFALLFGLAPTRAVAQVEDPSDMVRAGFDADVAAVMGKVEPEFVRHTRQITTYGTPLAATQPTEELVDEEVAVYEKRKKARKVFVPNKSDALLCFNLLIHRPKVGRRYLQEIVAATKTTSDQFVAAGIVYGMMVSGEWGEKLAVKGLEHEKLEWRRFYAMYLSHEAAFLSSCKGIREVLTSDEADSQIRAQLYSALALLKDKSTPEIAMAGAKTEKDPAVRAKAVFAVAEILGRDARKWLESLEPEDPLVKKQVAQSLEFLRKHASEDNKHGYHVGNDLQFVMRFGTLRAPAMLWLRKQGRLEEEAVKSAKPFDDEEKAALFDALDAGLGFGLEAIKGSLFKSLKPADLARLHRLRSLSVYSPERFGSGRRRTLIIMIRSLR